MARLLEYSPGKAKPPVRSPALHEPGGMVHTCHASTQEAEPRGLRVEHSLSYIMKLKPAWVTYDPAPKWKRRKERS